MALDGRTRGRANPARLASLLGIAALLAATAGCGSDDADEPSAGADNEAASAGDVLAAGDGARGVTDETIKVGMARIDPASVGEVAPTPDEGDVSDIDSAQATVDYINANGGIAGRQVEVVNYELNVQNLATASGRVQENQAACAAWTEDDDVFVFSGDGVSEDVILDCAADTETPIIAAGPSQPFPSTDQVESMSDFFYTPNGIVTDRRERGLGEFLEAHDFFDDDATVGILIEDRSGIRAGVDEGLKPALEDAGLDIAVEIEYPDPIESPWTDYVLQLKSAGVTHVVFSASTGFFAPPLSMMTAAEDQAYQPRWALASDNSPADLVDSGAPPQQVQNVVAMGWFPNNDVGDKAPVSARAEECGEIMEDVGLEADATNFAPCEFFFFLRDALELADEVSPEGLAAGVAQLGDDYQSVYTIDGETSFDETRHDGATTVRPVTWDDTCSCLQYSGDPESFPG